MQTKTPMTLANEVFADSFMKPHYYIGDQIQMEIMEAGLDLDDKGIYCRLSADGYMDCTDWSGPLEDIADAAQYLIDTYAE
jgi:hypothetical protein